MRLSALVNWKRFWLRPGCNRLSAPPAETPQLFSILPSGQTQSPIASRPEGDLREAQGRFGREEWEGAQAGLLQYLYDHTTPRMRATEKSTAYIKIAEGCDHPGSFCVIPNLRGKFRSRRFASVISEAEQLIAQGVREITLIGQDTTCYGEDLGMKDGLAQLLDRPGAAARPEVAPLPVRLSEQSHRAFAGDDCRARHHLQIP